jgi:hypothetical protein
VSPTAFPTTYAGFLGLDLWITQTIYFKLLANPEIQSRPICV